MVTKDQIYMARTIAWAVVFLVTILSASGVVVPMMLTAEHLPVQLSPWIQFVCFYVSWISAFILGWLYLG